MIVRGIITMPIEMKGTLKLFQLISPSLPTGAFSYSQGLEWAVENGWIGGAEDLLRWLGSVLQTTFGELEIPVLQRLYSAVNHDDLEDFTNWCNFLLASRETSELRLEENNRGRALAKLLADMDKAITPEWLEVANRCQAAGYALASVSWKIDLHHAVLGYTWSWLENMVMAGVKLIPLGQTAGQLVLADLHDQCCAVVQSGLQIEDDDIAGSCPAFAIASCLHETQYTRLFRS